MPRAQISGFTVISGSRILVPTEIATIDSAVVLPVTGTVEWVGTIGTIQTVVEVGTIDLVLDIATVQTVVGTIKTQELGGTITATILGTVLTSVKETITATILGTVLTSVEETVGLQPGGTITATILGTTPIYIQGVAIAIPIDLQYRAPSYDIIVSTILTGTNPATIISDTAIIKDYYQKLISIYFTGTTTATILIEASRVSDSTMNIPYIIGTIVTVGTPEPGKAYEILTDNWGYLRTTIIISTIDIGSLSIEVDKQP